MGASWAFARIRRRDATSASRLQPLKTAPSTSMHMYAYAIIYVHTHILTIHTITYYIPIYIILYIHTHVNHTYSIIFNHIHIWFGTVSLILRHWWNMLFSATSPSCYLISIRWCNRNVVLRVELASGHPVHDGMQSPAPLSMSIHDMTQEIKWCLMIPLRTS